jgi:hypothetical protein
MCDRVIARKVVPDKTHAAYIPIALIRELNSGSWFSLLDKCAFGHKFEFLLSKIFIA